MEMVAFVEARLADDERVAQDAARTDDGRGGAWTSAGLQSTYDARVDDHIARNDPARVLRELPLKRRLLDEHRPRPIVDPDDKEREDWPERVCRICDPRWMGTPDWEQGEGFVPPEPECCEYVRLLAAPYADHPDFRAEWSPVG